jgi:hypothetical protein
MTPLRTTYLRDRTIFVRPKSDIGRIAALVRGGRDIQSPKLFSAQNVADATKFHTLIVYGIGLGKLAIRPELRADIGVYSRLRCRKRCRGITSG